MSHSQAFSKGHLESRAGDLVNAAHWLLLYDLYQRAWRIVLVTNPKSLMSDW